MGVFTVMYGESEMLLNDVECDKWRVRIGIE